MDYLLDTNVVSDLIRNHPKVDERLSQLSAGDRAMICAIVRGECVYGVERLPAGRRKRELETKMTKFLNGLRETTMPAMVGDQYSHIKNACARIGLCMDENDLWIAATATAMGAVLVTRDSDFQKIAGLVLEDWTR